jgi:hypothetical protein
MKAFSASHGEVPRSLGLFFSAGLCAGCLLFGAQKRARNARHP